MIVDLSASGGCGTTQSATRQQQPGKQAKHKQMYLFLCSLRAVHPDLKKVTKLLKPTIFQSEKFKVQRSRCWLNSMITLSPFHEKQLSEDMAMCSPSEWPARYCSVCNKLIVMALIIAII